jgi:tetratricopeptide (TPR) repeat protein
LKCFLNLSSNDLPKKNLSTNASEHNNSPRTDLSHRRARLLAALAFVVAIGWTIFAMGELPSWIRNVEAGSALQAVFFRMMSLPGGDVLFRRPPRETRPALAGLIKTQASNADLYSLRALEDEQQLDFIAAESDWKSYVEKSSDKINAQLALADFYHRRLRPADEIASLSLVATAPPVATEGLTAPAEQRSWKAFDRIFGVIQEQGLSKDSSIAQYRAWIARYPQEQSLYTRFLQFLVSQKEYAAAGKLIADYGRQFPNDRIFPVKARAMVEYRQGSVREGLAVYEQSFQTLWDAELVKSYFDLLRETENLRKFLDQTRAALKANPEDLNATARLFYYYQQQGKLDVAQQAIAAFRQHKEASKSPWTSQELYICARLLEDIHAYPESARYYFALYNSNGLPDAQEQAIAGLTNLLLTAPETPMRFGSGELSMYRDIATMDQGPGYLNGILSLILNTTEPASKYSEEEQRAVPYFHRARAAELLALLDEKFPNSARRPELHSKMLEFYASAGESDAVLQGGREFLANYPNAPQRTSVALLMADAFSRKDDSVNEFAIYDTVLHELAAKSQNVPLGSSADDYGYAANYSSNYSPNYASGVAENEAEKEEGGEEQDTGASEENATPRHPVNQAFQAGSTAGPTRQAGARSPEYARVLERYLARLTQMKQIPKALGVLRREIDRNPDDPGLYERLAVFLDQNQLGAEQEEVYRRAMARFADRSWYDKLARFYLRQKKDADFEQLTREAVRTFSGTDLERYFNNVSGGGPVLYLRLNQYAHERFPHNPVFVHNLLAAYQSPITTDWAAWETLLRQHWFEETDLRNEFFEYLSRTGKLESELATLRKNAHDAASWDSNPAAANFIASAELWQSHFEQSAPLLKSLAAQYPAEPEIASTASSVYRSLAYFDPADTAVAVKIEDNLLQSNPRDTELMARIGDIYADRELFAQAAPYWERIPQVAPGEAGGYLESATIYWDYYDFENALRVLKQGRQHLGDPNLYSYEAGAIYENRRDYVHAIDEYVRGSVGGAPDSAAELRLLQLARRAKSRDLVDQATAKIVAPPNSSSPGASMPAVLLRVKVLEAQDRKPEMESLLDAFAIGATSSEQAQEIEELAQQKSLEAVRQHALERQVALTTDPVARLQLRYAVIQLYEGRKDFTSAEKNVAALYRENPKILGVVRATVDFYWRIKNYPQAISILLQAAKDAYPDLSKQFTYEAARKSTDAKQYQQARDLLTQLLKDSPYNAEYLAAMADAYALAGDDQGLRQFYVDEIALFRNAPLPADSRKAQIAVLRRGLVPALTRMKDYTGAVDQYIELVNNLPDDDTLATEAALYALRYQRQQQLVDFYAKTVVQSPRDYRWSTVLARIHTSLENYPAAIDVYAKAIAIRPDRVDLYTARATLEERLMRFDDAASDYEHIYQLAYKDPQWMEKVAAVRARQGKDKEKEVVAALQTALIDGRPENANNYFEVARRLESWGMLTAARAFADRGVKTAGPDLLAVAENHDGAKTYVRIMTRLRQHEQAYITMQNALADASSKLPVIKEQVEKQGIAAVTDAQWRDRVRQTRISTARDGMAAVLEEMGDAVNNYFTPEERVNFASFAEAKRNGMNTADLEKFAIPLAESAALSDQESRWRFELMMRGASAGPNSYVNAQPLIDLERRRGRFAELASQLEHYTNAVQPQYRSSPIVAAADAYRSAGDEPNELRLLSSVFPEYGLDMTHQQRYFQLLLARQAQDLVRLASNWRDTTGEQAADYVIAHGSVQLSHTIVQARGQVRQPVWNKSYNALVGLYFSEPTPEVNNAFLSILAGDAPIGARLAKPVDRAQQLAGNTWFYYGSRYGEYLGTAKLGNPEDFLPAILEQSPATSSGYLALADYYAGAGDMQRAIADYNHTLELSPNRPEVYDKLAVAYYKKGDRAAALAHWRLAFAVLAQQLDSAHVPESFWTDFGRTCDQLRARRLYSELKPDADAIIRTYLHRNGNWRSNALLQPAYAAIGDPASATVWLLDISTAAPDPAQILADVAEAPWIPPAERAPIYQRIIESKQEALGKLAGLERDSAQEDIDAWQVRWIEYLVHTKKYAQTAEAIAALPKPTHDARAGALVPLDFQVAAQLGTLDQKIAEYRAQPQTVPASNILRSAARQLFEVGDKQSARKILEFVFAREIDEHQLNAANFLGLAEIRLASGDTPGALDLLRRLVAVVGNPFENLDPAAALLEKSGHNAEAIEFLDQLVKSAPWDASYRLRLAKAKTAAGRDVAASEAVLASVAAESNAAYNLRVKAAIALAGRSHSDLGSGELNLLAGNPAAISATAADKFYFYEARIRAAHNTADAQTKIQLLSHCIIDFPRRDEARVPLFLAAAGARSDEFAIGVLDPLLGEQFLGQQTYGARANDDAEVEEIFGSDDAEEDSDEAPAPASTNSTGLVLSRAQQAHVAETIGDTMTRLQRRADAVSYFEIARRAETSPAARNELKRKIAAAKNEQRVERQNAARQPILHEPLEQDRVVRPRLVARAAPAPEAATVKTGLKQGGR